MFSKMQRKYKNQPKKKANQEHMLELYMFYFDLFQKRKQNTIYHFHIRYYNFVRKKEFFFRNKTKVFKSVWTVFLIFDLINCVDF